MEPTARIAAETTSRLIASHRIAESHETINRGNASSARLLCTGFGFTQVIVSGLEPRSDRSIYFQIGTVRVGGEGEGGVRGKKEKRTVYF